MQVHGKLGGEAQEWARACLGCVGRGSNAQAVRDEILNIMHRNHIGEKRGTWMEVLPRPAIQGSSSFPTASPQLLATLVAMTALSRR